MAKGPLGRTGRRVSVLGLGCASYWARPAFPERTARAVFETALGCGITLFDTGASYAGGEAERRLGRMVRRSGADLDDLVVATKAGKRIDDAGRIVRDFSPEGIVQQVDDSLRRLDLERITLLQLHGPAPEELDDALLDALERLRTDGKVELIGINAHADVLEHAVGRTPFDVVMPFISVLNTDSMKLAARARTAGQGILAAEPLGRMRFAPPLRRWLSSRSGLWYAARALAQRGSPSDRKRRRCLRDALSAAGWTPAQLALRWVLDQPGVDSAVFGTTRPEHVVQLAQVARRELPADVATAVSACLPRTRNAV